MAASPHAEAHLKAVEAIRTGYERAALANKAEAIVQHVASDAVYVGIDGRETVGKPAIHEGYAKILSGHEVKSLELKPTTRDVIHDIAVEHGTYSQELVPKGGGKAEHSTGNYTAAYKLVQNQWQLWRVTWGGCA